MLWWALGQGGASGRPQAPTWEETSHDDCRDRRRAEGRWEEDSHTALHLGLVVSLSSLTWISAPFTLTFTSSVSLLPTLKGSSKLLKGPQDQQRKSHLPGPPPWGMCAVRAEGGERHSGGWTGPPSDLGHWYVVSDTLCPVH